MMKRYRWQDAEQRSFLEERLALYAEDDPRWIRLAKKLLAIGGLAIVPQGGDDALDLTLGRRARVAPGSTALLHRMVPSECHSNVCELAGQIWDDETLKIATGWALSPDGLWRRHSWAVTRSGRIVETTAPRDMYYGVTLTPQESRRFIRDV